MLEDRVACLTPGLDPLSARPAATQARCAIWMPAPASILRTEADCPSGYFCSDTWELCTDSRQCPLGSECHGFQAVDETGLLFIVPTQHAASGHHRHELRAHDRVLQRDHVAVGGLAYGHVPLLLHAPVQQGA